MITNQTPFYGEAGGQLGDVGTIRRGPAVIDVTDTRKKLGDLHVLDDVSLTLARGEVAAVVGPSGSGKSTLCRTINALERIDAGSIYLDGVPLPQFPGPVSERLHAAYWAMRDEAAYRDVVDYGR